MLRNEWSQRTGKRLRPRIQEFRRFLFVIRKSPTALAGGIIVVLFIAMAVIGYLLPLDAYTINAGEILQPPSLGHPLGTDNLGRDIFSRILAGAGLTFQTGLIATTLSATIGLVYGATSAWFGGRVDGLMMRVVDLFLSIPQFLLVMALTANLGPSLLHVTLAISIVNWAGFARVVRAQVLSIKTLPYIDAAKSVGTSNLRIITRHILPNSYSPILVLATLQFAVVILTVAGLSFLGFGAQPPSPEWGLMVAQARTYITLAPWYALVPGLMILIVSLGFNLLGDGLRDAFDPYLRRTTA